jgi:hypothetical protein
MTSEFTGVKKVDSSNADAIIENKKLILPFELAWRLQ